MSLLLDALKKAAEQKLKSDTTVSIGESQSETEVMSPELQETEFTASTIEGDTELQFGKEPDDTTTFGLTRTENIDESMRLDDTSTAYAQNSEPLELPDISEEYDLTLQTSKYTTRADRKRSHNTGEPVSMTGNFQKAENRYQGTPYAASQMFISKSHEQEGRRQRMLILGGVFVVVALVVSIMFIYDYLVSSIDQNTVAYRPQRPRNTIKHTEMAVAHKNTGQDSAQATIDPGLLVEKESYENIFNNESISKKQIQAETTVAKTVPDVKPEASAAKKIKRASPQPVTRLSIGREPVRETLQDVILNAYDAYQRGDYLIAQTAYFNAALRAPDNRDVLLGLAAVTLKHGDRVQAKQYYLKLLEKDPKDANAIAGLAAVDAIQNTRAVNALDETRLKLILREQPEAHQLYFTLGNQYASERRWADAQQEYFRAHRYDPENPDYLFNLAIALEHLGQRETAVRFYTQAINAKQHRAGNFDLNIARNRIDILQQATSTP